MKKIFIILFQVSSLSSLTLTSIACTDPYNKSQEKIDLKDIDFSKINFIAGTSFKEIKEDITSFYNGIVYGIDYKINNLNQLVDNNDFLKGGISFSISIINDNIYYKGISNILVSSFIDINSSFNKDETWWLANMTLEDIKYSIVLGLLQIRPRKPSRESMKKIEESDLTIKYDDKFVVNGNVIKGAVFTVEVKKNALYFKGQTNHTWNIKPIDLSTRYNFPSKETLDLGSGYCDYGYVEQNFVYWVKRYNKILEIDVDYVLNITWLDQDEYGNGNLQKINVKATPTSNFLIGEYDIDYE
ncbi:hypothetical protein SCORR_v1c05840 [Spiroplasma corruscae]|uniref:Lipoprotein n=1 Tax=Spiroplasma corruscae TaxID=216934 RepID=A0A222EPE4_9MOLU|nr:hypothetical protein [Spiroplasma corruscae]ASP28356.1 hypothetical protein SCORR_v1c05840 [Spiroplasma corruscae]